MLATFLALSISVIPPSEGVDTFPSGRFRPYISPASATDTMQYEQNPFVVRCGDDLLYFTDEAINPNDKNKVKFRKSSDDGQTWSSTIAGPTQDAPYVPPTVPNAGSRNLQVSCAMGPDDALWCARIQYHWDSCPGTCAPEWRYRRVKINRSTDCGETWSADFDGPNLTTFWCGVNGDALKWDADGKAMLAVYCKHSGFTYGFSALAFSSDAGYTWPDLGVRDPPGDPIIAYGTWKPPLSAAINLANDDQPGSGAGVRDFEYPVCRELSSGNKLCLVHESRDKKVYATTSTAWRGVWSTPAEVAQSSVRPDFVEIGDGVIVMTTAHNFQGEWQGAPVLQRGSYWISEDGGLSFESTGVWFQRPNERSISGGANLYEYAPGRIATSHCQGYKASSNKVYCEYHPWLRIGVPQ